jgi:hypothetical protein
MTLVYSIYWKISMKQAKLLIHFAQWLCKWNSSSCFHKIQLILLGPSSSQRKHTISLVFLEFLIKLALLWSPGFRFVRWLDFLSDTDQLSLHTAGIAKWMNFYQIWNGNHRELSVTNTGPNALMVYCNWTVPAWSAIVCQLSHDWHWWQLS